MSSEQFIVVIPARFGSARLPGKPLADIGGRPMIAWVHDRALASGASEVIIATDDQRIAEICVAIGAQVQMTSPAHESGTDRIAEVAAARGWPEQQIVVNVQGDEPLLPPALISQVAGLVAERPLATIATLMTPVTSGEQWRDPNCVKVIVDHEGWALYFSRAAIPYPRDGGMPTVHRHVGLYAYRAAGLKAMAAASPCELEQTERLEQLRALWLGQRIAVAVACEVPPGGVDTEEDLAAVRRRLMLDRS